MPLKCWRARRNDGTRYNICANLGARTTGAKRKVKFVKKKTTAKRKVTFVKKKAPKRKVTFVKKKTAPKRKAPKRKRLKIVTKYKKK